MLTDTHAHLYWDSFKDDLPQVLDRAKEAGLSTIINVGVDVDLSKKALEQVEGELAEYPDITFYSTIGIHPHESSNYSIDTDVSIQRDIEKLEKIYQSNPKKVVGVGECGLDYFFERNDHTTTSLPQDQQKLLQRRLLLAQKGLAQKLNLPLVVHVRDDRVQDPQNSECWNEAIDLIADHFGILHCYSGMPDTTRRALSTKYFISFAANITYPKNEYLREAAKTIPLERIVLETDCPFLSPQSQRGQRNEPSSVSEIAQLIAELKGINEDEVAKQTSENVKIVFGLK